eukprot:UN01160
MENSDNNKENEEKDSLIGRRSITMKSSNYKGLYAETLLHSYTKSNSKRIQRTYSSPFIPLDSHIVFTNI